jgi:hypothetical protein
MSPIQSNSRECLQRAIDVEIKSLEESIRALKFRRNTLSPISSLPPEVFATIFFILCLPGTPPLGVKPDHHLARLTVSHVCHRWREIALNQPLLWSHVDFTTLSLADTAEILVRAKSTPLCLEAKISSHRWDDVRFGTFRKQLQEHVHHIRYLKTIAKPGKFHSTLEGLISPAPTLEYLSLSSRGGRRMRNTMEQLLFIPDTLFAGSTPRLSWLELRKCNISWTSPLFKGLKYLKIFTPFTNARPNLAVWLDTLNEMPQLKTLTLHSASPIAPPLPFDVERTVTLPSLTRLDILASPGDCSLALAHLDLPALTWLRLLANLPAQPNMADLQHLVPYVARHAHGPHDTLPLQSVLIRSDDYQADILAWTIPNIDDVVHDPPTLLAATQPTRVALSFMSGWLSYEARLEILYTVMPGLPLDSLVTLAAHDLRSSSGYFSNDLSARQFWPHILPKWPLLQRALLWSPAARGFIETLREDNGGRERPLLPSLRELVAVGSSHAFSILSLSDTLMKRVEQGVPLEFLDLRAISADGGTAKDWFRSFSEIVVDVLDPEEASEAREQIESMWNIVARVRGPLVDIDGSREESRPYTDSDETDG